MPRYAASGVSTRSRTSSAGGHQPGDGRRARSRRERDDHHARGSRARGRRRGPRRHRLAADELRLVDERARAGRPRAPRSPPTALEQERVATGQERDLAGPSSSPWRWIASTTRSPVVGDHAREHRSPMSGERGGIITSASPMSGRGARRRRRRGVRVARAARRRARTGRPASRRGATGPAGIVFGRRSGQQPRAERRATTAIAPISSGTPASANSKNPNPVAGRAPRRSSTRSRSRACRSAPASTRRGRRTPAACSSCDGARPVRTAITTTTGSSAATAPLTLISAVSAGDQEHRQQHQPGATRRPPGRPAAARPTP